MGAWAICLRSWKRHVGLGVVGIPTIVPLNVEVSLGGLSSGV